MVRPPDNKLEPDLQVYRSATPPRRWSEVEDRWLAVEVASLSTRTYDREYKAPGSIQLGVREVWLVDRYDREVRVATQDGEAIMSDTLRWVPPPLVPPLQIDLPELFRGLPEDW